MLRPRNCHKGDFGHAWIVAGSSNMPGAGRLAAEAAMRSGAGKTTWVTTREAYRVMGRAIPEVMALTFAAEDKTGTLPAASIPLILKKILSSATAVGIGPGLGRTAAVKRLVRSLIKQCPVPLVLDADALWAVEGDVELIKKSASPVILTPHEGELARLFGADLTRGGKRHRSLVAKSITNQYHCVLVWKGPRTLVVFPTKKIFINRTGNAGLAKGGSGDVLTGIITALAAQGFEAGDAARIGVHAHGRAADLAAQKTGLTAMAASDVIHALPAVWRVLEKRADLKRL